jgi:dihydropteroate synthase
MSQPLLWRCGTHTFDCSERTIVMGVLNVTPDSFSDFGVYSDPGAAVERAEEMAAEGADIIDVGGESTRPGSDAVPVEEESARTIPVIEKLAASFGSEGVAVSIDTRKHEVADAAVKAGASIVNDISAGSDPEMFATVAATDAAMVLMHIQGDPKTMQKDPSYTDVVAEVKEHLRERIEAAEFAGLTRERLCIDPGLGFGKTLQHNLNLMRNVSEFLDLGAPVMVGPSRKSFIGKLLDAEVDERLEGTAGAVAWLVGQGAHVVRVHDVKEMVRVVRVVDAIRGAGEGR